VAGWALNKYGWREDFGEDEAREVLSDSLGAGVDSAPREPTENPSTFTTCVYEIPITAMSDMRSGRLRAFFILLVLVVPFQFSLINGRKIVVSSVEKKENEG